MTNETQNPYLPPDYNEDSLPIRTTRWRLLMSLILAAVALFIFAFSAFSLWLGVVVANQKYLNWWPTNTTITDVQFNGISIPDEYVVVAEFAIATIGFLITGIIIAVVRKMNSSRKKTI